MDRRGAGGRIPTRAGGGVAGRLLARGHINNDSGPFCLCRLCVRAPALRCRRRLRRLRRPPCSVSVAGRRVDSRGAGGWKAGGCRMGIRTSTSRPSIPRSPRLFLASPNTPPLSVGVVIVVGIVRAGGRRGRGGGVGGGARRSTGLSGGVGWGGKGEETGGGGGVGGGCFFLCGCFLCLFPSPVTPSLRPLRPPSRVFVFVYSDIGLFK